MTNDSSPDITPSERATLNRRHFIRNAAAAAGAVALPAAISAHHDAAVPQLPESEASIAAWQELERRLADTLSDLSEDEFLVIEQKVSNRFVQFAAQGRYGMRVEAVANTFLPPAEHLSNQSIASLLSLGWHAPTYDLDKVSKEPPDGSPNFFLDAASPVPFERLAALAVTTLRDVYGVDHPGQLQYVATSLEDDEMDIRFPSLRLKREK